MSILSREKSKSKILAIAIVCLLLSSVYLRSQTTQAGGTPSPQVPIQIEARPKTATVGDPIQLELDVTMPQGSQAEVSRPVSQAGDFVILDFSSGTPTPETKKKQEPATPAAKQAAAFAHYRARITIAIYKPGKFVFPSMPVKIKTPEGKEIVASSPAVEIEIRSILTDKNPSLKDLKKQAEIPEPTNWLLWIVAILSGCLLCGIIWYLWQRRRRKSAPLTPAQTQDLLDIAETDLRNLLARGLPAGGMEKQFYVALSEIVKRILEAGYGIHTAELTTSEIMDVLHNGKVPDLESRNQIESFFIRCDVVKFAKYVPMQTENEAASQDALRILAEVRKTVGSRQSLVGSK